MKTSFPFLFVLLSSLLFLSCGGGDEDAVIQDVVTEEINLVSRLCDLYGISKDDFYDYWGANGYEHKTILANGRKADDKIYVAIYDSVKKDVTFTDTHFSFVNSMEANYYENRYTYNLTGFYPTYCETDNGFVVVVNSHYGGEQTIDAKFVLKMIFFDGSRPYYKEIISCAYVRPYRWYNNSCIITSTSLRSAKCYNDKGEVLYEDLNYIPNEKDFPVSYTDYVSFGSNGSLDNFQVAKMDVLSGDTVWKTDMHLVENQSEDMHATYTMEGKSGNEWTFACKVVSRNGEVQNLRFLINVDTGEYTIL